jgi:hypothetical protein
VPTVGAATAVTASATAMAAAPAEDMLPAAEAQPLKARRASA